MNEMMIGNNNENNEIMRMDISAHIQLCITYLEAMVKSFTLASNVSTTSSSSVGLKSSMSTIYKAAIKVLQNLQQNHETEMILENLPPDGHWMGNYAASSSSSSSPSNHHHHFSASNMVQDLIITTSFLCSSSMEAVKNQSLYQQQNTKKETHSTTATGTTTNTMMMPMKMNPNPSILENWTLLLAPYWGLVCILTQLPQQSASPATSTATSTADEDEDECSIKKLKEALIMILKSPKHMNSSPEHIEEIVIRVSQAANAAQGSSSSSSSSSTKRLFNRLRRALKSHLRSVLLFGVLLSLSLHSDLSQTYIRYQGLGILPETIIQQSDDNCLMMIQQIVVAIPRLTLITDIAGTEASPLTYCTAFRDDNEYYQNISLQSRLALGLTKLLTKYGPSAIALADRLGMCPLHYAARKGHSVVMNYLACHYPYATAFKDMKGKLPIHHAILNWKHHDPEAIVLLAERVPISLLHTSKLHPDNTNNNSNTNNNNTFKVLSYVQKNCPLPLYTRLLDITTRFTNSSLYTMICASAAAGAASSSSSSSNKKQTTPSSCGSSSSSSGSGDASSIMCGTDGEGDGSVSETSSHYLFHSSSSSMDENEEQEEDEDVHNAEESLSVSSVEVEEFRRQQHVKFVTSTSTSSTTAATATGVASAAATDSNQEQMLLLHFANSLLQLQSSTISINKIRVNEMQQLEHHTIVQQQPKRKLSDDNHVNDVKEEQEQDEKDIENVEGEVVSYVSKRFKLL